MKSMLRTGSLVAVLSALGLAVVSVAHAAGGVQFSATIDRSEISSDESVSLKLSIKTEGTPSIGTPTYNAPGFDLINQFDSSYVESYYDNGQFGVRNTREITRVLHPQKTGMLNVSDIEVNVGGTKYKAPSLGIRVTSGGAASPPPKNYGGAGVGLRGAGKKAPSSANQVFVRAEVDKTKAFKGEQIIVSYYLYRRVRVFNIQVDKYPTLGGFLREDLEMPVLGQRLPGEVVVLDGIQYERSLLTRYAVYPLKEEKLSIDPMQLRATYYAGGQQQHLPGFGSDDLEEAFQPFANFFQQMTPQTATSSSDPVSIEVVPLPQDGKPSSFTGGVGQFDVQSVVDKYDVKAGEAITLTVKVEGRGNLASIEEPKIQWPAGVEMYDTKGRSKPGKGGVGEKVFEILLIPRTPGRLTLPGVEFAFFDPQAKKYVTKSSAPVDVNVMEGTGGNLAPPPVKSSDASPARRDDPNTRGAVPGLQPLIPPSSGLIVLANRGDAAGALPWISVGGLIALGGWMVSDQLRRRRRKYDRQRETELRAESKSWLKLRGDAREAAGSTSFRNVTEMYERLTGAVYDSIDRIYSLGARALPSSELRLALVEERGLPEPAWKKLSELLDFAETVRFASAAGAISEAQARSQLERWVTDGQSIEEALIRSVRRAR